MMHAVLTHTTFLASVFCAPNENHTLLFTPQLVQERKQFDIKVPYSQHLAKEKLLLARLL
jgi:hypothetical protein